MTGADVNAPRAITKLAPMSVPTGNIMHLSKIREGNISAEVWCHDHDRRRELGLPIYIPEEE